MLPCHTAFATWLDGCQARDGRPKGRPFAFTQQQQQQEAATAGPGPGPDRLAMTRPVAGAPTAVMRAYVMSTLQARLAGDGTEVR
jgi:hypothetical protein